MHPGAEVAVLVGLVGASILVATPAQAADPGCEPAAPYAHCVTFTEVDASGTEFVLPEGITEVYAEVRGADGGRGNFGRGGMGGLGGLVSGTITGLVPGETLTVTVGGTDGTGGGGAAGAHSTEPSGNGGGASAVWRGTDVFSVTADPLLLAGGGGGATARAGGVSAADVFDLSGGNGGGAVGGDGARSNAELTDNSGRGGTQESGGAPGTVGDPAPTAEIGRAHV